LLLTPPGPKLSILLSANVVLVVLLKGFFPRRYRNVEALAGINFDVDAGELVGYIGVVFGQRTLLWWDLPVIESFQLLRDIYRISERDYKKTSYELIDRMNLVSMPDTQVRQLFLGQRMRCDWSHLCFTGQGLFFWMSQLLGWMQHLKLQCMNLLNASIGKTMSQSFSQSMMWTILKQSVIVLLFL
jgi:hypothetical protein